VELLYKPTEQVLPDTERDEEWRRLTFQRLDLLWISQQTAMSVSQLCLIAGGYGTCQQVIMTHESK